MRNIAFTLSLVFALTGCGLKGPLYIPEPEQSEQIDERKPEAGETIEQR